MLENNRPSSRRFPGLGRKQRGGAAVEFALLALVFFGFVFAILELARAMYMFNILQEVTRRAGVIAANSGFDNISLNSIRSQALFRDSNGNLVFGAPITPAHLRIDYFSIARDASGAVTPQPVLAMPPDSAQNYANCTANPYDALCVRLVRVRICQPGGGDNCTPVPYQMLFPLIDLSRLSLPRSETIVPVNTLGYRFSP